MNILTFDIEDWYCGDNISRDMDWLKFKPRISENVDRILDELEIRNQKATFFCLGWLAEHYPNVIKKISNLGHEIGCHTYQHELLTRFDRKAFDHDCNNAISILEDTIGKKILLFRAPAFSVTKSNLFVFEVLHKYGITTDCSIFPASRDFGGMPNYTSSKPSIVYYNGISLKEFPINIYKLMNKNIVYSGGGYFRLLPYWLIKKLTLNSEYVMTYFHPRDFDVNQPRMNHLPKLRQFKNEIGLNTSFGKFRRYLDDFNFVDIKTADKMIDWSSVDKIYLK